MRSSPNGVPGRFFKGIGMGFLKAANIEHGDQATNTNILEFRLGGVREDDVTGDAMRVPRGQTKQRAPRGRSDGKVGRWVRGRYGWRVGTDGGAARTAGRHRRRV